MNKKGWLSQAGDTIIFDMDGTLIDSVGVWNDVDAALIKELGGPAKRIRPSRRGEGMSS